MTAPAHPTIVPLHAVAQRMWLATDAHTDEVRRATQWLAGWGDTPRGTSVALRWDDSGACIEALWVATRLGLDLAVVSAEPLDESLWTRMDDQSVAFGGRLRLVAEVPSEARVIEP